MGVFGFFLFLSVVVIAVTMRSIKLAQIRQDALVRIIESGQPVSTRHLEMLSVNPPELARWVVLKLGVLITMGLGSIVLSLVYWADGMLPVLVAGHVALLVAYATWSKARSGEAPNTDANYFDKD